jgi:tetratricopeptide (TPR) repeat protein
VTSWLRILLLLSLIVSVPSGAWAKPTAAPDDRAVELNDEGEKLYQQGDYAAAAKRFEAGYALDPNPTFLYNLALAYEKNSEFESALDALKRYRDADPNAPDKAAIDARIDTLQELVGKIEAEERQANEPDPEPIVIERDGPGVLAGPLPWVLAGVGAAGVVVGGVLGALAVGKHDDAVAEPVHATALDMQDEAERLAVGSTIGFVAGGVLLATGVTLGVVGLVSDSADEGEGANVSLTVAPGGLCLRGAF